jgi:hypothetical protein
MKEIEIRLPRCRLVLFEDELLLMLRAYPEIWEAGLKRGKGLLRQQQTESREANRCPKSRQNIGR